MYDELRFFLLPKVRTRHTAQFKTPGRPRVWLLLSKVGAGQKADRAPRAEISEGFCQMGRLKKVPSGRGKNSLPAESGAEPLAAQVAARSNPVVSWPKRPDQSLGNSIFSEL